MYLVKNPFREIEGSRTIKYVAGQDVSHLPEERLKELHERNLIEAVKGNEEKPKKKGK